MSRIELSVDAHVFHAFLKFKSSILADEKDKKKFLDFVLRPGMRPKVSVLAFVVLDNEAHFLLDVPKEGAETKNAACEMLNRYEDFLKKEHFPGESKDQILSGYAILNKKNDILETCRYIHSLPVLQGYVQKVKDYWWSSFQTYRGTYCWKGIDIVPVLHYFTENGEKSRIMFLRYHRQES